MRKQLLNRIEKLEKDNLSKTRQIWLLEHPRKYAFDVKVEFRIIDRYDKEVTPSFGIFSTPNINYNPIYKNEVGIIKGVHSECKEITIKEVDYERMSYFGETPVIKYSSYDFERLYIIEFDKSLIHIEENNILKVVI